MILWSICSISALNLFGQEKILSILLIYIFYLHIIGVTASLNDSFIFCLYLTFFKSLAWQGLEYGFHFLPSPSYNFFEGFLFAPLRDL